MKDKIKKYFFNKFEENPLLFIVDFFTNKIGFTIIFSLILYNFHMKLSEVFLSKKMLSFNFFNENEIILINNESKLSLFYVFYKIVTFIFMLVFSFIVYRSTLERIIKPKKEVESELKPIIPPFPFDSDKLQMIVGLKHEKFTVNEVKKPEYLIVPEKGMFQNFFITGTIGTGKTASVMYPFLRQAIFYGKDDKNKKAGMLILDVKGNFYEKATEFAEEAGRKDDLIVIKLGGEYKYNPLAKPNMEAIDLANRSRTVLDLFSGGGKSEKFWDTKSGQMMAESIRLLRIIKRKGYVNESQKDEGNITLGEIHKVVTDEHYLNMLLNELKNRKDMCSEFDYNLCLNYFKGEFNSKAQNTIATVKACVTEMTGFFASSESIHSTFCPSEDEKTFKGFEECINEGKIVILAMNKAKYPQVSRTIAAYLKLDFQSEVQQRTSADNNGRLNKDRPMFFFCDEYQEFVTSNDADFYGLSRESKCCSIVSSQSYTSVLKTLGDDKAFNTLQQNLINKIWLRSDDKLTIETAQLLTGKEEKEKFSKNISESLTDAKKSKIFGRLESDKASFSESVNVSTAKEFLFDERIFTQELKLFTAVSFTAHDEGMNEPYIVHLMPYFKEPIRNLGLNEKEKEKYEKVRKEREEKEKQEEQELKKEENQAGISKEKEKKEEVLIDKGKVITNFITCESYIQYEDGSREILQLPKYKINEQTQKLESLSKSDYEKFILQCWKNKMSAKDIEKKLGLTREEVLKIIKSKGEENDEKDENENN